MDDTILKLVAEFGASGLMFGASIARSNCAKPVLPCCPALGLSTIASALWRRNFFCKALGISSAAAALF